MRKTPCISVVMPVFNVENYISHAIDSILSQSFEDFEFIIIDDASTDNTASILSKYNDSRIVLIRNIRQIGVARSINKGIYYSRGKYIARMDGDDISLKDRFEKQIAYMEYYSNIGICGSFFKIINRDGQSLHSQKKPIGDENIRMGLFWGRTSLAHPSIIIRKGLLDKYNLRYDPAFYYAEDYDLYCRSSLFFSLDNIPEELIEYRIHENSVSQKYIEHQKLDARMALYLHLKRLGLDFKYQEFISHGKIFLKLPNESDLSIDDVKKCIEQAVHFNNSQDLFDKTNFECTCKEIEKKYKRK